jgi:hypothetical protein
MASDVKSPADLVRGHVPVLPPRWVRNVPVCCGGVVVNAGDLIVADAEGIVVVPRTEAATVREHVRQRSLKASAPRGRDAYTPEAESRDRVGALAGHLEQRAKAHYGAQQANVPRSSIFAGVFAAAGGIATDWDETQRASRRNG